MTAAGDAGRLVAVAREVHQPTVAGCLCNGEYLHPSCFSCRQHWPCEAIRLAEALEEQQAMLLDVIDRGADQAAALAKRAEAAEKANQTLASNAYEAERRAEIAEARAERLAGAAEAAQRLIYCYWPGPTPCPMCGRRYGRKHFSTCALGQLSAALGLAGTEGVSDG